MPHSLISIDWAVVRAKIEYEIRVDISFFCVCWATNRRLHTAGKQKKRQLYCKTQSAKQGKFLDFPHDVFSLVLSSLTFCALLLLVMMILMKNKSAAMSVTCWHCQETRLGMKLTRPWIISDFSSYKKFFFCLFYTLSTITSIQLKKSFKFNIYACGRERPSDNSWLSWVAFFLFFFFSHCCSVSIKIALNTSWHALSIFFESRWYPAGLFCHFTQMR